MRFLLIAAWLAPAVFAGAAEDSQWAEFNVNSRYTVERIDFGGDRQYRLSSSLVEDMQRLIGEKLNVAALSRLAKQLTQELRATSVTFRVARGSEPAHVRVKFDVEKQDVRFDVAIPTFSYTSREGLSGAGRATATFGPNVLAFTAVTNGDDLVERYSGIRTRYDRLAFGSERVHVGVEFDAFREQYNRATLSSLGDGGYRSRLNVEPSATFVLAKPLTLTVGFSFEKLGPSDSARGESVNAVVNTLAYHRDWEGSGTATENVDAAYNLRAASRTLASDYAYTRHSVHARYAFRRGPQSLGIAVQAGVIYGRAPLFERFVLGNSETLRGWNKYDLAPLGGNHIAHASVTYGYHIMRVFYDTGAIWDRGKSPEERHSAGVGITTGLGLFGKNALLLAVAFPIRRGAVEPVFIAGMNF